MVQSDRSIQLTPRQFESRVRRLVKTSGSKLTEFKTSIRQHLFSESGRFEIDIVARFEALGVPFIVLIECKMHKRPIDREVVQVLRDKVIELGAHKGVVFAINGFQSGAVAYAKRHGISLVVISPDELVRTIGFNPRLSQSHRRRVHRKAFLRNPLVRDYLSGRLKIRPYLQKMRKVEVYRKPYLRGKSVSYKITDGSAVFDIPKQIKMSRDSEG